MPSENCYEKDEASLKRSYPEGLLSKPFGNSCEVSRYNQEYRTIVRKVMKTYMNSQRLPNGQGKNKAEAVKTSRQAIWTNSSLSKIKNKVGTNVYPQIKSKMEDLKRSHKNAEKRKIASKPKSRSYKYPTNVDILSGTSKTAFTHPGNVKFRLMIANAVEDYSMCNSRYEKSLFIRNLVKVVIANGGSFLKYDKSQHKWYDGGISAAKIRVCTSLRDASIPNKNKSIDQIRRKLYSVA